MTIDEIRQLVELVRDTGVGELEVHWGEDSVRVKGAGARNQDAVVPVIPLPMAAAAAATMPAPAPAPPPPPAPEPAAPLAEDSRTTVVKSPIVGTYYDAPAPGADVFVKVGDQVEPKQVLCIIESMKLMNEIEAETTGIIVAKHVENGRPVEYGESLFTIRQL
ncbi:MAG: acetyl-CoA carboxylase biotin carboxyl carrier protein [Acidobacteriaceae bacterium]|nr:acetyl-CoA carboxylase biotin carboxyl carrier protein [Acidobacteriaceae bacterium]MBV8571638.1 acetyl-CoA carboxylase biotin carboxyl carrier protein [Acidobacteriaceae bacterium]